MGKLSQEQKSSTSSLTIKLPRAMKELIEQRARAANYPTTGDFVADLMKQKIIAEERSLLNQMLKEGLKGGKPIPVTPAYWKDLEKRCKARAEARRNLERKPRS